MSDVDRQEEMHAQTQWMVGIAALRRIGGLVQGFQQEEEFKRRASRVIAAALGAVALVALALFVFRPNVLLDLFRALS